MALSLLMNFSGELIWYLMLLDDNSLLTDLAELPVMRKASSVAPLRRSRLSLAFLSTTLLLVLSSCATSKDPQDTFTPEGPYARSIKKLASPVFIIAVVIGIFVYALVLVCAVKFRRKNDDHVPKQIHGNAAAELTWTAIPAAILAVVGIFSVGAVFDQAEDPKGAMNITVIGHQWWWEYHYPPVGQETLSPRLVTKADPLDIDAAKEEGREPRMRAAQLQQAGPVIVVANELHVPAGRVVRLQITSHDVMHNYWVPKLAGKIYAIPGKINKLTLDSDPEDAGKVIYGQCAEYCGTSHANMRFKVVIDSPEDYQTWLANQAAPAIKATGDAETNLVAKGEAKFVANGCTSCHYLESDKINDQGIVGKIGPNLTHVGSRKHFAGAIAELNETNLTAWIRNPQKFKPGSRMVIGKQSEEDIEALVAYIKSLK
jgi:cytochrome c oxidase subunit II